MTLSVPCRGTAAALAAAFVAVSCLAQDAQQPVPPAPTQTVILDTSSFWRFRIVRENNEIVMPSGEVAHASVTDMRKAHQWYTAHVDEPQAPPDTYTITTQSVIRLPADTSRDWMKPGFDDSTWARLRGPLLANSNDERWKLVLARGQFEVLDPGNAGDLSLSLAFRGGAIVYLNGEEIARSAMPQGKLDIHESADPYPEDVYFDRQGFAFPRQTRDPEDMARVARRVRNATDLKVPAAKLRKGINTLAIANHRSPAPYKFYTSHNRGSWALHNDCYWARIGLGEIRLVAGPRAAVIPNTARVNGRGFRVWNQSPVQNVYVPDYPDPFASVSPVRLITVRNGMTSGQLVVNDDKPITGLAVTVAPLRGPGTVPPTAVRVRYAMPDGKGKPVFFDSLEEEPPAEVAVDKDQGGSIMPVWITVRVPPGAAAGDYTSEITVTAEGVQPVRVPLHLRVVEWTMPDTKDFVSTLDVIQSPESVAMAYDVPLWSDQHLKLLDRSFALMADLGCKSVYLTCVRRTHFGNEHAMVRWVRDDEGELQPSFDVVEKYLDVAVRHLGAIPAVILYGWEPMESEGHAGGAGTDNRTYDKPILLTLLDPETGTLSARPGPAWGTPESAALWKRLADGIAPVLAKRGLQKSLFFGLLGDARATKQAMDDMTTGVENPRWAIHAHQYCDTWKGYKIGMCSFLWGIGVTPIDPSQGYSFGWSNPLWMDYYPREMGMHTPLVEHRVKLERWMGAKRPYTPFLSTGYGPRGLGRIGGDFWDVLKDSRGRVRGSLAGRYPESYWGQLNLNYCISYIMGRGVKGPVATVRYEALREGSQEVEARIYLEKFLLDDEAVASFGDLAARCRSMLDERVRMCLDAEGEGQPWYISSDWAARTERLFGMASEVSKTLGREPNPNLNRPEPKKGR